MAGVTLKSVNKIYPGGFQAVVDFDLEICDEEFVVLVGPSGCGKTTTLRMIAGLEEISSGTIQIGDRVVNNVAPKDRDIAMVFQNYALYPHMTVFKNLAFALKLRKVPKQEIQERVDWAAGLLGLEGLLDRKPRQLSGGQRQRVAVGRAIVRKPRVFLFDEPLSNLDAKLRVTTRAEIKRLQQDLATTTVYVTHDQEEAMTLGDRVVVMNGGYVHQFGTPIEIYRSPINRFVAGFVGMPPMNFIEGDVSGSGASLRFKAEGIEFALKGDRFVGLGDSGNRQVGLGIRPEGLRITGGVEGDSLAVAAKVDVVEVLGANMDLYVTTSGGNRLIARVPTAEVKSGETVTLTAELDDVHLFAPDRGEDGSPESSGANLTPHQAAQVV